MASNVPSSRADDIQQDATYRLEDLPPQLRNKLAGTEVAPVTEVAQGEHHDVEENTASSTPSASGSPPKEWRSWKIKWPWMTTMLFAEVALIIATIVLERISASNNGIASIPQVSLHSNSGSVVADIWRYGLLWTTLLSLLMAIYSFMWGTVVFGTADRQPFIELRRPPRKTAANAEITIMLDYRSYPEFYNWIVAWFFKGHFLVGFAMLLSLLFSLVIVPLSAHLLIAAPSELNSTIYFGFPALFNGTGFTARSTLQPAIDLAGAIRIYGSRAPPWMTVEYAFEAFTIADETMLGNVTLDTNAYSAYLDCQAFSPYDNASYQGGFVTLQVNDRGCQVALTFPVQNNTPIYTMSWNFLCTGSEYGRIGLFAGLYSETSLIKLDNLTLVSCIPSYWNTPGSLTVFLQPNTPPQFLSFEPSKAVLFHPEFYELFERILQFYTFFDPSNTFYADAFGLSVYNYAITLNSSSPIQPDILKNAIESLFTTMYAGLAITQLLNQAANPRIGQGTLSTPVTRLFVVTPVAYIIVGIMGLILICNISLFVYAELHHSILYEEPIGLLGNAALLHESGVSAFVSKFREQHEDIYKMRAFVKENYSVERSKCWFDDEEGIIKVEELRME
jgi:hypothetical protein